MPELPEVETIRRGLLPRIVGIPITHVDVRLPKLVKSDPTLFAQALQQSHFADIQRQGKLLILPLESGDAALLLHLKMTGQLIYRRGDDQVAGGHPWPSVDDDLPNRYSHLIITFADGGTLYFNDQRQFGYAKLATVDEVKTERAKYGIEPMQDNFTFTAFQKLFRHQKMPLKALLLDQNKISGLGNIYVDEACFYAGVRPDRPVHTVSKAEQQALFDAILRVIPAAVEARGTTMHTYLDADGKSGGYASQLMVYGRAGKPCKRCFTPIEKKRVAGRGTHFCPYCEK